MKFPIIEHIDQVRPAVEGRPDFVVRERPGYTVIDYVYAGPDSFDDPIRRECRGLKFGPDGKVIARPFHKFFNLGEKPETTGIDVTQRHIVMDKLDGSMIHAAIVDGEVAFMTRMGITDVAKAAMAYARTLDSDLLHWCWDLCKFGATPIFEFTAPGNRIVLRYEQPQLTLLAVRDIRTGIYWQLAAHDPPRQVELIRHHPVVDDLDSFVAATRALKDAEGYVLRFVDTGMMVKLKADDYVLRHRAKDGIGLEKNALKIVLERLTDDTVPLLPDQDALSLRRYHHAVWHVVQWEMGKVSEALDAGKGMSRKDFALSVANKLPAHLRPAAFIGFSGEDWRECLVRTLAKETQTGTRVEELRRLMPGFPAWADFYNAPEEM